MRRMRVNSERVGSEQRGRLIVLPKVWAVAGKKPCRSVKSAGGERSANTEVTPLRFAPVEMTAVKSDEVSADELPNFRPPSTAVANTVGEEVVAPSVEMTAVKATEVAFYRKYTEAMLRRYAVMSMEAGRVPSMLGREMFRGKVTNYRVHGFDDAVIFCHDVESCLKRLSPVEQMYIKRIAVQQYTHGETAGMLGVCLRTCVTQYASAIDRLTRRFLEVKLLEPQIACQ